MGLRIAVLSRNFATTGGGAERYSIAVVEQLASRHDIHVFAQNIGHVFPGVTYHKVAMPLGRPRWINQLYFAIATWWATRKGFDVVHSHENTWHGNIQTVHVIPVKHNLFVGKQGVEKALRWIKVLTSPRLLVYLWLEKMRYAIYGKRRVVLTSAALRDVMLATYPQAAAAMDVITPGVASVPGLAKAAEKSAARTRLGLPETGRCLLLVGNDFRKKGLPALIQAIRILPMDICLAVVGASSQLAEMRQEVDATGLGKRVVFLGSLVNIGDAYDAADCLVHPTLEDTYAMVVLEAMAHGLPVIVSAPAYCGISGDLVDGVHALLLPDPRSFAGLAAAISRVLTDSTLAHALSENAEIFAKNHSWSDTARRYERLYERVSSKKKQRWLVLAHAFNMDGRAASQTITDKLPHLERAGIELVILSGVSGVHDTHFEHHQLWPSGPAGIRFELRHVLRKHLGYGVRYRAIMLLASLVLLPGMIVEKMFRPIESSWSWWFSAYCKGLLLARAGPPFDLIYSTGGAFAAHLAARQLKKSLNIPWVAEVHDPLVNPGMSSEIRWSAQQKMQAHVEHQICSDADIAIWFTDAALASAQRRQPQVGNRGRMLLPGVDRSFEVLPPYVAGNKFIVGHFGSLSTTRNLSPVIRALEVLCSTHDQWRNVIELHVYGGPLDSVSARVLDASPIRACVRHFGRIEVDPQTGLSGREQILRRMRAVDVLLLLHGEEEICAEYIPSKLYEYLWMQRPILALVHKNPQMLELIREQGHIALLTDGVSEDALAEQLSMALERYIVQWSVNGLPDNGKDSPYTTANAVKKIIEWTQQISTIHHSQII